MGWPTGEFIERLAAAQQNNEQLCDFTITCGDREWRVHKLILGIHGGPLRAAAQGDWLEAQSGKLDLSADPIVAVDALVQYLYSFGYELAKPRSSAHLIAHTQICILADKYRLAQLHAMAAYKFDLCVQGVQLPNDDLAAALAIAYDAPEPTTRIREAVFEHIVKDNDFLPSIEAEGSPLAELLLGNSTIARDLVRATMRRNKILGVVQGEDGEYRHKCDECQLTFVADYVRFSQDGNEDHWMRCPDGRCNSRPKKADEWAVLDRGS